MQNKKNEKGYYIQNIQTTFSLFKKVGVKKYRSKAYMFILQLFSKEGKSDLCLNVDWLFVWGIPVLHNIYFT